MPYLVSSISKTRIALGLGVAAVLSIGTALGQSPQSATNTPRLGGTYAMTFTSLCQQALTTNQNGNVTGFSGQDMGQHAGTITFTPTAAHPLSGEVAFSGTRIQGAALTVNGNGDPFSQAPQSGSGSYSMTSTAIQMLGATYNYYHGVVTNGVIQQLTFIGMEGGCSNTGIMVHQ
jgi:hypothetical protein